MNDPSLQRRFRPADSAIFRELDGEAIVLHLDTGIYFGLDAVGTLIWRSLARRESVGRIVGGVVGDYDVDEAQARVDVERLIDQLVAKGLVVADDDES